MLGLPLKLLDLQRISCQQLSNLPRQPHTPPWAVCLSQWPVREQQYHKLQLHGLRLKLLNLQRISPQQLHNLPRQPTFLQLDLPLFPLPVPENHQYHRLQLLGLPLKLLHLQRISRQQLHNLPRQPCTHRWGVYLSAHPVREQQYHKLHLLGLPLKLLNLQRLCCKLMLGLCR